MRIYSIAAAVLLFATTCLAQVEVAGLRCEYLKNPLGIDAASPRLSWKIASNERSVRQSACQVLVASSPELLAGDHGDLWDSGKIKSSQSIQVPYAGKPLASKAACFWKVRIWTGKNSRSAWSEPASWSMGLLQPADWTAKWIGAKPAPDEGKKNTPPPPPLLRDTFMVNQPVRRATVYICALGYYELNLNGAKVGDHVLDPAITQYDKRALYVTYDVTKQLVQGKNALGVELGSAWYNSAVHDVWDFYKAAWRALPQMRLQLDIEYADGSRQEVQSDGTWKLSTGPLLYDQTRVGEVYDARLEIPNWAASDYDDSKWGAAAEREGTPGILAAAAVEPIKVMAEIAPISIKEVVPGKYVFDFGQNLTGWPKLAVQGPAGTEVHMTCGEMLNADGSIKMKNINPFVKSTNFQTDVYTLKGGPRETWQPKFTYHGFQYVEVDGLPENPDTNTIVACVVHTAFEPCGSFECSNELLNKIERATVWSYIGNFIGFPSDCPHREKNGWTGDAQLAVQLGLEHFHSESAYTRWLNDLQDAQRPDGKLPCISPTGGWGYNILDGPAWESAYLMIPWEMYRQSGDRRILERHYDSFKKWIGWYERVATNGIVNYGLGDWVPAKTETPSAITSTAYYYRDLLVVSTTAAFLGRADEAKQYAQEADKVRSAFNGQFFNPQTAQYANGSQTALACALYQGLVNEKDRDRVAQNLAENVHAHQDHIDTGILGAKYILRALCDNGHADVAWQMATQTTAPSWGSWIERGATTLWEDWPGKESHNHVMFGDISSWFIEYLAGIRPDDAVAGYEKFIIRPTVIGDLTFAKATHDSMYGLIASEWHRDGAKFTLKITVPPNTQANVYLPAAGKKSVQEGGMPIGKRSDIKFLHTESGYFVYAVGSGTYEFASVLQEP